MNRQIRRLGIALIACFTRRCSCSSTTSRCSGPTSYNDDPPNTRPIVADFSRPRGTIISADGAVLARSVPSRTTVRVPAGVPRGRPVRPRHRLLLLQLRRRRRRADVQRRAGRADHRAADPTTLADLFVDDERRRQPHLTIRKDVQQVARDALGDQRGLGRGHRPARPAAILALWSYPSLRPQPAVGPRPSAADAGQGAARRRPGQAAAARAYRESFFPGSTFKVVTGSTGLDTGKVTPDEPVLPGRDRLRPAGVTDPPSATSAAARAAATLFDDPARSRATPPSPRWASRPSAPTAWSHGSEAFGFNHAPPIDLPGAGRLPLPDSPTSTDNTPVLAQASIGQNDVAATPLQMALVAAARRQRRRDHDAPRDARDPRRRSGVIASATRTERLEAGHRARPAPTTMREAMIGVVADGTANRLADPRLRGRRQDRHRPARHRAAPSHAWIIGFAGPPGQTRRSRSPSSSRASRARARRPAAGSPPRSPRPCMARHSAVHDRERP